jgi:hypothetical protein
MGLGGQNFTEKKNTIKTGPLHIYGLLKYYVTKTNYIIRLQLHLTFIFYNLILTTLQLDLKYFFLRQDMKNSN